MNMRHISYVLAVLGLPFTVAAVTARMARQ
jgi:hypothetical protein